MRAPERVTALAKANGWGTTRANLPGMSAAAPATAPQKEPMMSEIQKPKADGTTDPAIPETKADPTAIAEACAAANMPATMAAALMRQGATMAQVHARSEEAGAIMQAAKLAGAEGMGAKLVAAGVSLNDARDLIAEARASKDEAVITDPAHGGQQPVNSGWGAAVAKLKK